MEVTSYTARWILPVLAPPLERGIITLRGNRIVSVEPAGTRIADTDLGDVAVLPGLVNAHTHLDLTGARGQIPPTSPEQFPDWLEGVIQYRLKRSTEEILADLRLGYRELCQTGTTLVGDISGVGSPDLVEAVGVEPALRATLFRELIGLSPERAEQTIAAALRWWERPSPERVRRALSPHAPYTVGRRIVEWCHQHPTLSPMAVHLAESPGEEDLLRARSGPFVPFLQNRGVYFETEILDNWWGFLDLPSPSLLVIHANRLGVAEWNRLTHRHTIVHCPRTHAAFGHPPFPLRELLDQGIRVALGTDSLASNPDLDLFEEIRTVGRNHRAVSGVEILSLATHHGAIALGFSQEFGALLPGYHADLLAVPYPAHATGDPYEVLVRGELGHSDCTTRLRMFDGVWDSSSGFHHETQ